MTKHLYHGSSATPPSTISDLGFDSRFSNPGMWGNAIYFAANANYSDDYAHKTNG